MMVEDGLRTQCLIDLEAIAHNYRQIRHKVGPHRIIASVIKADAYGHGVHEVAQVLSRFDNTIFAVATPDEALRLRKTQPDKPILILGCLQPNEVEAIFESDCIPSIAHYDTAEKLNKLACKHNKKIKIHIETDTGIGRIGPFFDEAFSFIKGLGSLSHLIIEGLFTHFSSSDEDPDFTLLQLQRFEKLNQELRENGIHIPIRHTANSAAVIRYPQSYYEMVRPGLMLYGLYPSNTMLQDVSLKQAMTLKSEISHLRHAPSGYTVSYGKTYITNKPTTIATVNVGYRAGYSRLCSNKGEALVHGIKVPIIGRICMDQLMLDVTALDSCKLGDEVIFTGKQKTDFISLAEIADWSSTINYETACTIGSMNRRFYKQAL